MAMALIREISEAAFIVSLNVISYKKEKAE
jgi:hypothetical protein